MKYVMLALVFAVSGPASAEAPALEKIAGDVQGLVQDLRKKTPETPKLKAAAFTNITNDWDCEKVVFEENSPAASDPVALSARTWIEECRATIPGVGCIPERRVLYTTRRVIFVEILGRPVPGPREEFRVCLNGPWLSLKVVSSPNKYEIEEKEDRFTLTRQD